MDFNRIMEISQLDANRIGQLNLTQQEFSEAYASTSLFYKK